MLLFLHGFGSCGIGNKSLLLRQWFGEQRVLAPDLPVDPHAAIALAQGLIDEHAVQCVAGSSLGGYYATWLASQRRLDALLINPSVRPWQTLQSALGVNPWWCRDGSFEWRSEHLKALRDYHAEPLAGRYLVLLQSGDEVLDWRVAQARYAGQQVMVEQGGNHRFENLADYRLVVETFLATPV